MNPVTPHPRRTLRIVGLACLLALTACGGGGDDDAQASAVEPKRVSDDAAAAIVPAELAAATALLDALPAEAQAEPASAGPDETAAAPPADDLAATTLSASRKAASSAAPTPAGSATPTATVGDAQRAAAAAATAQSATNACAAARPFYWEIGSRAGKLAGGPVGSGAVSPNAAIPVASASKWLYGAYVAQLRNGAPSASDRRFLSMTSGYVSRTAHCAGAATVDACVASGGAGARTPGLDGVFVYNSGHMQQHASRVGLGALSTQALATAVRAKLGNDLALAYGQPWVAGGAVTTTSSYAAFLRKILGGQLKMSALLGTGAVCTDPATCPKALVTPAPAGERLHYAFGHWVEDDPVVGDGAFSSGGALGFYPWIDRTKSHYGIVARVADDGGPGSLACGRLIRAAWTSGVAR